MFLKLENTIKRNGEFKMNRVVNKIRSKYKVETILKSKNTYSCYIHITIKNLKMIIRISNHYGNLKNGFFDMEILTNEKDIIKKIKNKMKIIKRVNKIKDKMGNYFIIDNKKYLLCNLHIEIIEKVFYFYNIWKNENIGIKINNNDLPIRYKEFIFN
jgi:hypothetical protein